MVEGEFVDGGRVDPREGWGGLLIALWWRHGAAIFRQRDMGARLCLHFAGGVIVRAAGRSNVLGPNRGGERTEKRPAHAGTGCSASRLDYDLIVATGPSSITTRTGSVSGSINDTFSPPSNSSDHSSVSNCSRVSHFESTPSTPHSGNIHGMGENDAPSPSSSTSDSETASTPSASTP